MTACAVVCRSSAARILIGTQHHRHICAECAEVCDASAARCVEIGGMEACCRCGQECRCISG